MALFDILLESITEKDLARLIEAGAVESLYIDYKRQTYGDRDSDHAEFLADASSFANTAGGDLVIGMAESEGVPTAIVPFTGNADDETRRFEEIARSGLEPRIRNLRARAVPLSSGGHVIIVRVPRSYLPPHRVNYRGRNRFWSRASSGKYEPNVEELRHLFNDAPQLTERIRSFRTDRITRILAGETPVPLSSGAKIVLHVVPLPSFADNRLVDIVSILANGTHVPLPLDGPGGLNQQGVNLDGYLNYADNQSGWGRTYGQLFRSGAIEGVSDLERRQADGAPYLIGAAIANKIVFALRQYLSVLKSLEAGMPIYAFVSLCSTKPCYFRYSAGLGHIDAGPLNREVIHLPEVVIDSASIDVPAILRPAFNILWNAFGFLACDMYDAQGKWKGTS